MLSTSVTSAAQWPELIRLANSVGNEHIKDLFNSDPSRVKDLVFTASNLTVDFSRQRINKNVLQQLIDLANSRELSSAIQEMFSGQKINVTEKRSVLHVALRKPIQDKLVVDGVDVVGEVHSVLSRMKDLANRVRNKEWLGATGKPVKYIVNIGIGGSDLGPVMAFEALRPFAKTDLQFHFVSNVDGADLFETLKKIKIDETLFIVASKTFTTQETMLNANSAKQALITFLGRSNNQDIEKHFVALSTNHAEVQKFGINSENTFGFWDWVGGRYSMESAIGLANMIAIGPDAFMELLAGFHELDEHFRSTEFSQNIPVLMGLIGLWNRSLLNIESVAVLPYDQYLNRFPAYLQQLTMESNGKSVTRSGLPVAVETGALYWGEPGTNGQHSFYQFIHQGTSTVACDIIFPARSQADLAGHHDVLISNALSQAAVLAFGRSASELENRGVSPDLIAHKVMPGNRPTTLISFPELTPRVLGSLIALYEHMVFTQGVIWGINSFDQWGVELGKEMANSISPFLVNDQDLSQFDLATQKSIEWYRSHRKR